MTALLSRVAAEHGLSAVQLRSLASLRRRSLEPAELARQLDVDGAVARDAVHTLARRGLLVRPSSRPDVGPSGLTLTVAGRELVDRAVAELALLTSPRLARLVSADQQVLARLLARALA